MNKDILTRTIILSVSGIVYLIFTIRHFRAIKKNVFFSGGIKTFHLIMIWIIPFVWALLLRGLTKSTPGSHEVETKKDPAPFSDSGETMWTD